MIVINSGVPLSMYGLDVFTRLAVEETDAGTFATPDHPTTNTVSEVDQPWPLVDVALDLDVTKAAQTFVDVINGHAAQ